MFKLYMTRLLSHCQLEINSNLLLRNINNLCKIWTYKPYWIVLSIWANRQKKFTILSFLLYVMNFSIRGCSILFEKMCLLQIGKQ